MPALDIDVNNIPDIIEAQLTLSYSRLSDLIRSIITQGNDHEDSIAAIWDTLRQLSGENAQLREELQELRGAQGNDAVARKSLEELQGVVQGLSRTTEELSERQEQERADRKSSVREMQDAIERAAVLLHSLNDRVAQCTTQLRSAEESLGSIQAFVELWGIQPGEAMALRGHREREGAADDSGLVYPPEHRTDYLLSLPVFARFRDEMEVLRTMINNQSAEMLAARSTRANSAPDPDVLLELQGLLHEMQARLSRLEDSVGPRGAHAAVVANSERGEAFDGVGELQRRVAHIESFLSNPVLHQDAGGAADLRGTRVSSLPTSNNGSQRRSSCGATRRSSVSGGPSEKNDVAKPFESGGRVAATPPPPPPPPIVKPTQRPLEVIRQLQASSAIEPRSTEADDVGMCRRVKQLEEYAARLEVNKADRQELRAIEDAVGRLFRGRGPANAGAAPFSCPPPMPEAKSYPNGRFVALEGLEATSPGLQRSPTRPCSSTAPPGRSMFVSTFAMCLRDGAQSTNATISPAHPR